jgi:DMSO/TMAO reductase YedYZ molybdopterin-dependent catalytic subunit
MKHSLRTWFARRLPYIVPRGIDEIHEYQGVLHWLPRVEGYSTTIDMATALHPQTQLTFKFDHQILPRKYGLPMKCRMPTKLGIKNPERVIAMHVLSKNIGGYWEDRRYNWFIGL